MRVEWISRPHFFASHAFFDFYRKLRGTKPKIPVSDWRTLYALTFPSCGFLLRNTIKFCFFIYIFSFRSSAYGFLFSHFYPYFLSSCQNRLPTGDMLYENKGQTSKIHISVHIKTKSFLSVVSRASFIYSRGWNSGVVHLMAWVKFFLKLINIFV